MFPGKTDLCCKGPQLLKLLKGTDKLVESVKAHNVFDLFAPLLDCIECYKKVYVSTFKVTRQYTYENDMKIFGDSFIQLLDHCRERAIVLDVFYKVCSISPLALYLLSLLISNSRFPSPR